MLHNYLLVALRHLNRNRGYTAINVFGLAVGIACCLLILAFVRHELAHDAQHEHADRIVRVTTQFSDTAFAVTASAVAPVMKRQVPEVEEAVRLFDSGTFGPVVVRFEDRMFEESRFFYADSTVFDVFTLPLVSGHAASALTRPRTVVLTESAASKYFGDDDPLGQSILVNQTEFEVTGVLAPLPAASHIKFDFLAAFETLRWSGTETWTGANFFTYLLLRDAAAQGTVEARIEHLLESARAAEEVPAGFGLLLEPLRSIHLNVGERRTYIYLFSAIALLILLIACVNYMNLATARAAQRAKEVGIRKVTGARRSELVQQFYGESALLTTVGVTLAVGLAFLLTPTFRAVSGQPISFTLADPVVLGSLLAVVAVVTLVAGSYPALLLSSFEPVRALSGKLRGGPGAVLFRRGLVTFQFAVSVFLLVGTAVIFSQLRFVQTADLGFRGEQVVALPTGDRQTMQVLSTVKQRLLEQPGVVAAAAIDRLPGTSPGGYSLTADGFEVPEGMDYFPVYAVPTEAGAVQALGLELIAGKEFSVPEGVKPGPGEYQFLVNEALLQVTGWTPEEALGKRMSVQGDYGWGTVMGVFRDYHFLPLHEGISPLAFFVDPPNTNNLLIRISPAQLPAALAGIQAIWGEHVPHRPFTYTFLDEAFAAHYATERQLGRLFGGFALLAVMIACLGLLGLAAYAAERRRREIGVRKVLGARVHDIVLLLSWEFALLVVLGFAVAAPVAYLLMSRWLDEFAYRIELGVGLFLVAGAIAFLLALATVSGQALRAASADPVRVLRSE
jgi:putative ABC transport system permease protein